MTPDNRWRFGFASLSCESRSSATRASPDIRISHVPRDSSDAGWFFSTALPLREKVWILRYDRRQTSLFPQHQDPRGSGRDRQSEIFQLINDDSFVDLPINTFLPKKVSSMSWRRATGYLKTGAILIALSERFRVIWWTELIAMTLEATLQKFRKLIKSALNRCFNLQNSVKISCRIVFWPVTFEPSLAESKSSENC